MEPERKPPAPEKVLSVEDWESPEHAVRSIRTAIIASWVVLPLLVAAYALSRRFSSGDMRDLLHVLSLPSIFLAQWLLRKNVPAKTDEARPNYWMLAVGFASALGLLGGAIANHNQVMAIAASGLGVVVLYLSVLAIAAEVRLFRDPLRYLVPNEEGEGTRSPDVTASRFQGRDGDPG